MRKLRRYVVVLLFVAMLFAQGVYATETATPIQTVPETPSPWAVWEVQMANTYGLGETTTYQGYMKEATMNDFLKILESFQNKFEVDDITDLTGGFITRGQVIDELYDMIELVLNIEEPVKNVEEVMAYFVDNGLMNGRSNYDYALDEICRKEEMLVFSKRVYDHIVYTLGLDSKGAFWKVSDEDNTVYLLGSIHVTDDSVYPLSKEVLQAFISSQTLVVEANMLMVNPEDTAYIQQKMMLEGDVTIDKCLTEDTYSVYVEKISALGLEPEVYNKLKPWYAAMLLQSTSMSNASYSATMGIDMYFKYLANGHIPIVEVEGLKYQIDLFDSFSPELQEGYLVSALTEEEQSNNLIGAMLSAWKSGDVETLERLIFTEETMTDIEKEFSEKLWDERNTHMTAYVQNLLDNETEIDYFFVVGVGHMLNDNGIIEGLKSLGYEVIDIQE